MNGRFHTTTVSSRSTGIKGRCITSARENHFVVDDPDYAGGPNEAVTASEAFFSGLTACAALMLQRLARENNYPLRDIEVTLDAARDVEKPVETHSLYDRVRMIFDMEGVSKEQADELVVAYKRR